MPKFSDELLEDVLSWQTKRHLQIISAVDSTQRLIDLSKTNDEDSIDLEIDLRQVSIDELEALDSVFEEMTVGMSQIYPYLKRSSGWQILILMERLIN